MQRVDGDAEIRARDGAHHARGEREIGDAHPWDEFQIDAQPRPSGELGELGETGA
jgi:hypothetical protein